MIFGNQQKTLEIMRGHQGAADFIELIVELLHFWDDLVDRDHPVTDDTINDRMFKALITLPRNPFYMSNFSVLNTVLMNAITNWHVANKFERDHPDDEYRMRIAYILRSSYVDLITTSALLVGGTAWAIEVGEMIRLYAHKETYEGYLDNLKQETTTRHAQNGEA
jgi:hypothetical protein